jgi:8-oxo-dGTP pyrophosphatase MutT (NUDIX family)
MIEQSRNLEAISLEKADAAGGIFVFTTSSSEVLLGLQLRSDTDEWAATGGIIEDYDDLGLGVQNTIFNCIRRECYEELGTWYEEEEVESTKLLPYHVKQKLESHDGFYYTRFIQMNEPYYGNFIEGLEFNPSEVIDFDFRTLEDWLRDNSLHPKVREHFERKMGNIL